MYLSDASPIRGKSLLERTLDLISTDSAERHMFLGHFGVALAAKKVAPKTSLGTLVFAAQFADLLWPVLLLLGIEQVRIVPGLLPVTPLDFTSYPVSHSLVAQLGWGALLGLLYSWCGAKLAARSW
jgi:hypothetical protein